MTATPAPPPTVSVVIPVYNGAPWIAATLTSLAAQTRPDWEAIVVDDCSPDAVADIVTAWPDPRVRLVRMAANGGPVRARNRGVAEARGRYIAALDQDDLCRPDRFERQVAHLDAHPGVALLATQAEQLVDGTVLPMRYPTATSPALVRWLTWIENPLVWSSVMVRADVARRLDPFTRPDILYAEDFDLYHRIARLGEVARLDRALILYRQHAGGVSKRFADTMEASATRVLTEHHADILGDDSARVAAALVRYNMGKLPVPDAATLAELGRGIATLHLAFVDRHAPTGDDAARIIAEATARWHAMCRVSVRCGTLSRRAVAAATPPLFRGATGLLWPSAAIGSVRRVRQTFAA